MFRLEQKSGRNWTAVGSSCDNIKTIQFYLETEVSTFIGSNTRHDFKAI